ncbi:MAG TPA: lipid II flippase MurJ [Streptosporangiaceae bacterium]|nr:lipid II flippase MurJ [Streptosporangiaceae bacterium]
MTAPVAERGASRQPGRGIGRAAAVIGILTVASGVVGFGRQLIFAHTVAVSCVGTAYTTANQVPNIIYDIVLGGALTSAVVPVLAGPVARGPDGAAEARRISSALLTWAMLLLVPAAVVIALIAGPLTSVLIPATRGCAHGATLAASARMLVAFAPQIPLYGLAVVLYGILQSHRRFTAPALAPVLSSVVVAAAYVAFGVLGRGFQNRPGALPATAELTLSLGTTAGVLVLAVTGGIPVGRLRLGLRPTLRFPDGVATRVCRLAVAGVLALIAQDLSTVAAIVLSNGRGGNGAFVLYSYGWQVFFIVYAGLAVPVATSAFPLLAAQDTGSGEFLATSAAASRAVMLMSWLGAAVLAGACLPLAQVFTSHNTSQARQLAWALALFAPGLAGYGLAATLSRILYVAGRNRVTAVAMAGGWLLVIVADLAIVPFVPRDWVVPALGLGTTIGLAAAGIALTVIVRRALGRAALAGLSRATLAGLAGGVAGAAAGAGVALSLRVHGIVPNAAVTVLAAAAATVAFLAMTFLTDGGDLRAVTARLLSRLGRGRPPAGEPGEAGETR